MNGDEFRKAADAATASIVFDSRAVLDGVYAKNRRRTRGRRTMAAVPIAAALAVGGVTLPSIISPSSSETAVAAYRFDTTPADAPVVAEVDGIKLHYLPDGVAAEPISLERSPYFGGTSTSGCFEDACVSGLGVSVTRRPGLTLEEHVKVNWFGDPVETTVGGQPALANGVKADDAAGLVWSPEVGVVVEVHFGKGRAAELRKVVEAMSL
ncbi:hypothetical protein [uncultured Cellulomonas sp.]|uniref:hypothetical protein n=1 Tax=uncultured Cellulomonas sp. TaxID=189682 RepID=UPI0026360403|nr:hypothetical protein [uncultured Cellulomonas sp.]